MLVGTHGYTISKDIGVNEKKQICLPNKENISGHRYDDLFNVCLSVSITTNTNNFIFLLISALSVVPYTSGLSCFTFNVR